MVDTLYDCAKFRYECGNYSEASEYLYFYRVLVSDVCLSVYTYIYVCMYVCVGPGGEVV